MPALFKLDGKSYVQGSKIILNSNATRRHIASAGTKVILWGRHPDYSDVVGLYSEKYISGWEDLGGEVDNGHGFWINLDDLYECIHKGTIGRMIVNEPYSFNGVELRGKECEVLSSMFTRNKLVFVEFDEDIGGCSADGLGKRGYCAAIPATMLITKKEEKNAK